MTRRRRLLIVGGGIATVAIVIGALTMGPRVWRVITRLYTYYAMPLYSEPMLSEGSYTNVIFLHHSVGENLIGEGGVRALLTELGYQFWDHGYNQKGLVRPDGMSTGAHYGIPGALSRGDTDVGGLARLFAQPVTDPPDNAFSRLMQHEVIIVKSCFPNSAIKSDDMQEQFQAWYLQMRDVMDQHPDRIFILVTSPPLHPLKTSADEATRARNITNWLRSDEYLKGHPNIFVFGFFDLLADPDTNMLHAKYQKNADEADSHPNRSANEIIGPQFVEFVIQSVESYRASR